MKTIEGKDFCDAGATRSTPEDKQRSPRIEKILAAQPLNESKAGPLRVLKVRSEVSVQNMP